MSKIHPWGKTIKSRKKNKRPKNRKRNKRPQRAKEPRRHNPCNRFALIKSFALQKCPGQRKYWLQTNRIDGRHACPSLNTMKQNELNEELGVDLCQRCAGGMRLIGSEPHPSKAETDLLTYCCTACGEFLVLPLETGAKT